MSSRGDRRRTKVQTEPTCAPKEPIYPKGPFRASYLKMLFAIMSSVLPIVLGISYYLTEVANGLIYDQAGVAVIFILLYTVLFILIMVSVSNRNVRGMAIRTYTLLALLMLTAYPVTLGMKAGLLYLVQFVVFSCVMVFALWTVMTSSWKRSQVVIGVFWVVLLFIFQMCLYTMIASYPGDWTSTHVMFGSFIIGGKYLSAFILYLLWAILTDIILFAIVHTLCTRMNWFTAGSDKEGGVHHIWRCPDCGRYFPQTWAFQATQCPSCGRVLVNRRRVNEVPPPDGGRGSEEE